MGQIISLPRYCNLDIEKDNFEAQIISRSNSDSKLHIISESTREKLFKEIKALEQNNKNVENQLGLIYNKNEYEKLKIELKNTKNELFETSEQLDALVLLNTRLKQKYDSLTVDYNFLNKKYENLLTKKNE